MAEEPKIPDIFRAYEEGKHRRYNLLFAVNGGAFAVAKLLPPFRETSSVAEPPKPPEPLSLSELPRLFTNPEKVSTPVLGNLNLGLLSLGMALFTIVMVVDIFIFGERMRKDSKHEGGPALFGWQGKLVLILIGSLIVTGWTLVSFEVSVLKLLMMVYLGSIVVVYLLPKIEKQIKKIWSPAG